MKTSNFLAILITAAVTLFNAGCGIEEPLERVQKTPKPYTKNLPAAYDRIHINQSTSASVLETIKRNKQELISQSESVIASYGEKKKGYSFWMTMTAFDEEDFTVTRKYFLAVDEKPWFLGDKGMRLRFDVEVALDDKTLSEAYTSENQKRIAILKKVLEDIRDDVAQIRQDSSIADTGGMMINQTFERILYILNRSPALAERLDQENGLDFDHPTLDTGRIGMRLRGDVVKVKIRIGRLSQIWNEKPIKKSDLP